MVWPRDVDWQTLQFGVEIEFVEAEPEAVKLLPGWVLDTDESQRVLSGGYSGAEIKPTRLRWPDRDQIGQTFAAIEAAGGAVNWSCGLHVHVGLEPWGEAMLRPLLDGAIATQGALRELFRTAEHRMMFCPDLTPAMRDAWVGDPREEALLHRGRPQSHRCGVNLAAWYGVQTVELRFPNATLDADEACRAVELCLRWVAAVGAGRELPTAASELAATLGVPAHGYPPPHPEPVWHQREEQLTRVLLPVLQPLVEARVPGAEILVIRPVPEGFLVKTDKGDRVNHRFLFRVTPEGFALERVEGPLGPRGQRPRSG
jgi:hypothetical protein